MTSGRRRMVKALLAAIAVGGLGAWLYYEGLKRAWIRYNRYDIRSEGSLQVGDLAPDLVLEAADGTGPRRLSDLYRNRPAVLVFGSYT